VIDPKDAGKLQKNLLISHATGVGTPFPKEVTKLAVVLRIVNFLHGHS
jgi:histidine ammonia-lyase